MVGPAINFFSPYADSSHQPLMLFGTDYCEVSVCVYVVVCVMLASVAYHWYLVQWLLLVMGEFKCLTLAMSSPLLYTSLFLYCALILVAIL